MDFRPLGVDYSLKSSDSYQDVKLRLHHYLIDRIDIERVSVGDMGRNELSDFVLGKVSQYVAEHRLPGPFLEAVLSNDLKGALVWADIETTADLLGIIGYCEREIPGDCWGSPEKVAAWLAQQEEAPGG